MVVACASNTPGKAERFAQTHQVPDAYEGYDDLLARSDIDAVYVATTHNFHHENVIQALEAGKAVLCEKPMAVNGAQTRNMVAKAREKNLFLMEAMWTRFLPAIRQMKSWLEAEEIGTLKMMRADFCIGGPFPPEHRLMNPDLAGGALLDAGIYPVSMASFVMGGRPEKVAALADIGITGVDEQSAYLFQYADGRMAMLSSSVCSASQNRLEIVGSEGRIVIPNGFLSAREVELHRKNGERIQMRLPYAGPRGFCFEIQAVHEAMAAGEIECPLMPPDESVAIAETMDLIQNRFAE